MQSVHISRLMSLYLQGCRLIPTVGNYHELIKQQNTKSIKLVFYSVLHVLCNAHFRRYSLDDRL